MPGWRAFVSLGSVAYQPLLIFYRSPAPINRLAELAGKRVAVGAPGSGTHALALALLAANGITGEPTIFVETDAGAATSGLLEGKLDAVFLMGDSAPIQTLRTLVRSSDVQLYNFSQADAYVRRFSYLTRMELPAGSIDLGKNLPAQDVVLVGPTVELVARDDLNPALSDIVLEVAKEVHGKAGLLQKRGEFPAPLEHDFKISDDARVYYKSGMGFLLSHLSLVLAGEHAQPGPGGDRAAGARVDSGLAAAAVGVPLEHPAQDLPVLPAAAPPRTRFVRPADARAGGGAASPARRTRGVGRPAESAGVIC